MNEAAQVIGLAIIIIATGFSAIIFGNDLMNAFIAPKKETMTMRGYIESTNKRMREIQAYMAELERSVHGKR